MFGVRIASIRCEILYRLTFRQNPDELRSASIDGGKNEMSSEKVIEQATADKKEAAV